MKPFHVRTTAVALVVGLAGCAAARAGGPLRQLGDAGQELAPGRYTRAEFTPRIGFSVREGWTAQQVAPGFFDVQQDVGSPDVIAVQFATVAGAGSAAEAAAAIRANPQLRVVQDARSRVGGHAALRLLVETLDPAATDPPIFRQVLTVTAGPIGIASGRRLRIDLIDTGSAPLAILVGGSIAQWARALEVAEPVVRSVSVGGG